MGRCLHQLHEMLERMSIHPVNAAACKSWPQLPMQISMDISAEQADYTRPTQIIICRLCLPGVHASIHVTRAAATPGLTILQRLHMRSVVCT